MTISKRVMKLAEYPDGIYFRLACGCMADFHDSTIELEYDKELNDVILHFYRKVDVVDSWCDNWWERLKCRVSKIWKMLIKGYFEYEDDILIMGEEHISDFIEALNYGKNKMIDAKSKGE